MVSFTRRHPHLTWAAFLTACSLAINVPLRLLYDPPLWVYLVVGVALGLTPEPERRRKDQA